MTVEWFDVERAERLVNFVARSASGSVLEFVGMTKIHSSSSALASSTFTAWRILYPTSQKPRHPKNP